MKTNSDPILQEVWRIKDASAARHQGDVHALAAELRQEQCAGGRRVLSLPAKRPKPATTKREP